MCIFKNWLLGVQLHNLRWEWAVMSRGMWRRGHKQQRCLWEVLLLHQGAAGPPHTPRHSPDPSCGCLPRCSLLSALHSHPSADKCTAPARGVHPHPHGAHSHPAHHLTTSQTHLAHPFTVFFLVCYQAFLQHLQEETWKLNISCKSLWHISRQCSGTKKISFFQIIQPQLMHDPKIKFYLITANFTVALPVTTKQIRKLGVIVKWVGKLKQELLVQSRAALPSPIDEAGQGTTWNHFYEMPCLSDPKNVHVQQGREAAYIAGHLQAEEQSWFPIVQGSHWVTISGVIKVSVDVSFRDTV